MIALKFCTFFDTPQDTEKAQKNTKLQFWSERFVLISVQNAISICLIYNALHVPLPSDKFRGPSLLLLELCTSMCGKRRGKSQEAKTQWR